MLIIVAFTLFHPQVTGRIKLCNICKVFDAIPGTNDVLFINISTAVTHYLYDSAPLQGQTCSSELLSKRKKENCP